LGPAAPPESGSAAASTGGGGTTEKAGNLSTYKELCSLATDLGQPDLIYMFMDLAHHNQALMTRRGAAFGFAAVAQIAGSQLAPHITSLIPKLYRYQYDPNPKVRTCYPYSFTSVSNAVGGALIQEKTFGG
jgi:proteasome component ECM29